MRHIIEDHTSSDDIEAFDKITIVRLVIVALLFIGLSLSSFYLGYKEGTNAAYKDIIKQANGEMIHIVTSQDRK